MGGQITLITIETLRHFYKGFAGNTDRVGLKFIYEGPAFRVLLLGGHHRFQSIQVGEVHCFYEGVFAIGLPHVVSQAPMGFPPWFCPGFYEPQKLCLPFFGDFEREYDLDHFGSPF